MGKRKKGNSTQIRITRTVGEWNLIFKKITPPGKPPLISLSKFIRREVLKVKNRLNDVPESVTWMGGEKKSMRPYIDNTIIEDIKHIATAMQVPESDVIDRLIITPLLQPQP